MKTAALLALENDDPAAQARTCGLRYVSDSRPGFSRRKFGKHFVFYNQTGERIKDKAAIARIRKLAIPPAYRDVWICPQANGHLQATGYDARGRKQYCYHPDWRTLRDSNKFNHILAFGERLPIIRETVNRHMGQRGLSREKVLATVVALLERTLIRVGNDEYARKNKSFGLTTLLPEHVEVNGHILRFCFTGKSGKSWNLKLSDRRIARIVRACAEIDGQELFKFKEESGEIRDVTSGDVNAYLREIAGEDFTAKDFRTWTGTVLAALALRDFERFDSAAQGRRNVMQAIEKVSKKLGNTPAVCRKSYIHPQVIEAYLDGSLSDSLSSQITDEIDITLQNEAGHLSPEELLVLTFLKSQLT